MSQPLWEMEHTAFVAIESTKHNSLPQGNPSLFKQYGVWILYAWDLRFPDPAGVRTDALCIQGPDETAISACICRYLNFG
jgi:hypothetical protein